MNIYYKDFKDRELEVLGLIAEGLSNKEIADKLFIAVSTVRWHNRQLYSKLGVHSRTLAVAKARELGLLDRSETGEVAKKSSNAQFADTSSFIGREREIAKAKALLHKTRLLTLTGPGGSGKTRLALKLAQHLLPDYPDGIYFVPLAPIQDAELVGTTIAGILNISEMKDEAVLDTLIKELTGKHLLLIIDNFEHVMSAVSLVSTLLKETTQLQIIVTSREVLRIYGEQEYHVPPLQMPSKGETYQLETIQQIEAVQLFVERARAVRHDFRLTEHNVADIASLCIYLDGLPLALELVASHSKMLSPAQILERMKQGFDLLSRGSRDAPARQRTLNATIDWSYQLLSPEEQYLFAQLSLFDGGFTLEAVEEICSSDNHFDIIASLYDKSLLRYEEHHDNEPRFFMLETIRQYARDKFRQTFDETAQAKLMVAFATYFADFAGHAGALSISKQQNYWLNRIDSELDNLRAVLHWSMSPAGDKTTGFRVFGGLGRAWYMRAHMLEGIRRGEQLLQYKDKVSETVLPAVFNTLARLKREVQENEIAVELHEQAIFTARRTNDIFHLGYAIGNHTTDKALMGQLSYEEARERMAEAIQLFEEIQHDKGLSGAFINMGEIARFFNDFEAAYEHYTRGGEVAKKIGNSFGLYANMVNRGFAALKLKQLDTAKEHFTQTLQTLTEILPEEYAVNGIVGMIGIYTMEGNYDVAVCLAGGVETILRTSRTYLHPLEQNDYDGFLATIRDNLPEEQFERLYLIGAEKTLEELVHYALES